MMNLNHDRLNNIKANFKLIEETKTKILTWLYPHIAKDLTLSSYEEFYEKFKYYKYIQTPKELNEGCNLLTLDIQLDTIDTNAKTAAVIRSCIFCKLKYDNLLLCKSYANRYFSMKFDEFIVFERFTKDEIFLLSMFDANVL